MQKITPFLWFDTNLEEALAFYTSIFPNSTVSDVSRYGEGEPGPAGGIRSAVLVLEGQRLLLLNGGPHYKLSPAVSLFVSCEDQAEVDDLWARLTEGGEESRCGWLVDKYGLSWQIIPTALGRMLGHPDPEKARRAMMAMFTMKKIDIAALEAA